MEVRPVIQVAAQTPRNDPSWGVSARTLGILLGLVPLPPDVTLSRLSTDSRDIRPGDLFVALPGERVDGHDFVAQAFQSGALAALVERPVAGLPDSAVCLAVPSTLDALTLIAGWWRNQVDPLVLAITGSNGKTTVKEMLSCILAADARARGIDPASELLATQGNFNNHLGLPLTLLRLRHGHRRAVLELGMNHAGELASLSRLARPRIALVNNVQRAHVGLLGSLEAVADAKAEIFGGLEPSGTAVINADDGFAERLARAARGRHILRYSAELTADVGPLLAVQAEPGGQHIVLRVAGHEHAFHLPVPGRHNVANAMAAIAMATAIGIPVQAACEALQGFSGVSGRLQSRLAPSGATVIDDTYNANPDSVLAAIRVLAARPGTRILVLGDLGELGEGAPAMHAELGAACRAAGIDHFFGLGTYVRGAAEAFGHDAEVSDDVEALCARIRPLLDGQVTVLVKGSRFMRMERVVAGLCT